MTEEFNRVNRIEAFIARRLAEILRSQLNDPRLKQVTIMQVRLSRDMSIAKVYVSTLSKICSESELIKLLDHAKAYLRTKLAHNIPLRRTPALRFIYDTSVASDFRIKSLIDEAMAKAPSEQPFGEDAVGA